MLSFFQQWLHFMRKNPPKAQGGGGQPTEAAAVYFDFDFSSLPVVTGMMKVPDGTYNAMAAALEKGQLVILRDTSAVAGAAQSVTYILNTEISVPTPALNFVGGFATGAGAICKRAQIRSNDTMTAGSSTAGMMPYLYASLESNTTTRKEFMTAVTSFIRGTTAALPVILTSTGDILNFAFTDGISTATYRSLPDSSGHFYEAVISQAEATLTEVTIGG